MVEKITCCDLWRMEENEKGGTFGVLLIDSQVFCCTLEPPDKLNHPNVSCIPAQQYTCNRHGSPRFGETFEVWGVPDRSEILFHSGNVVGNTRGCILLGSSFGKLGDQRAVLNSGETFKDFMAVMSGINEFRLTIHTIWG